MARRRPHRPARRKPVRLAAGQAVRKKPILAATPPRHLRLVAEPGAYTLTGAPTTGWVRRRIADLGASGETEDMAAHRRLAQRVRTGGQRGRATRAEQRATWHARIVAALADLARQRQARPPRRQSRRQQARRVRALLEDQAAGEERLPSEDFIRKFLRKRLAGS
jgi:hypothetical protein